MPEFGDFESKKDLKGGRDATIYEAVSKSQPSKRKFAVKVWRNPHAELIAEAFESVNIQKAAAGSEAQHLAPILDSGLTEDGQPWYVTHFFETSVAKFIRYNAADSNFVYRLVDHVLQGLGELWNAVRRPHGNLKPTNIFLDGDPRTFCAVLSDPAALPDEDNSAEDLFALGSIVYQIVHKKSQLQFLQPPLSWSAEWEPFGRKWLDFTNRLLDRSANRSPEAVAILRRELYDLSAPTPGGPDGKGRKLATFAFVLLFLAAGGTAAWYYRGHSAKEDHLQKRLSPAELEKAKAVRNLCLKPPPALTRLSSYQLDNYLQTKVFERLPELPPDQIVSAFLSATGMDQWPTKRTVKQASETYQTRGWTGLSRGLLAASGDIDINRDLAPQLIATLEARESVDRIDSEWGPLYTLFTQWADDKALAPLKEWEEAKIAAYTDAAAAAQEIAKDREELRDKAAIGTLRLNRSRFIKALASTKISSPQDWLEQAQQYQRPIDTQALTPWRNRLEVILKQLPADQQSQAQADVDVINECLEDPVEGDIHERGAMALAMAKLESLAKKGNPPSAPAPSMATNAPSNAAPGAPTAPPVAPAPAPQQPAAPDYSKLQRWVESLRQAQSVDSLQKLLENAAVPTEQQAFVTSIRQNLNPILEAQASIPKLAEPWKLVSTSNMDREKHSVAYEYSYGPYPMTFVRVPGQPCFMAAAEMPLGLAIASHAMPDKNPVPDGPQVWAISGRGPLPSGAWRWKKREMENIAKAIPNATFYPTSAEPEPPSLLSPLNAITGEQAKRIAESLQCRLPSAAEWNAAYNTLVSASERPQLRGGKWLEQFNHWIDYGAKYRAVTSTQLGGNTPWPDDRSYLRGNWPGATPRTSSEAENRVLWFRNVHEASPTVEIYDMLGNVAEFLSDGGSYSVIGGSAISNPDENLKQTPVRANQSYSDVGIRLVVDAVPNNDLTAIHKWLDSVSANLNAQIGAAH